MHGKSTFGDSISCAIQRTGTAGSSKKRSTRSNAYANRQTCSGQKRLLALVATMSRCHQRNICARRRSEIISIRNSRASRHESSDLKAERIDEEHLFLKINFRFRNIKLLSVLNCGFSFSRIHKPTVIFSIFNI